MLLNELRKQSASKLLIAVIAALVVINCVFCSLKSSESYDSEKAEALKAAEKVVRQDPEGIENYYRSMSVLQEEYNRVSDIWFDQQTDIMMGVVVDDPIDKPTKPWFGYNYHPSLDDFELLDLYYNAVIDADEYSSIINDARENARLKLIEYKSAGYSEDSYAFKYQVRFWNIYGDLLEQVKIDSSLAYGWDLFWEYDATVLFLLISAIIVGNRLFALERDTGMGGVVRLVKHGRKTIAVTKILYATVIAFGFSFVFNVSSLLICALLRGLSSPFAPLQQNASMIFTPIAVNQLEAFVLCVFLSALAFLALYLFTAFLTLVFRRTLPAIGVSALIIVAELYLKENGGELLSQINIFNCSSGEMLFSGWRAVHIFNEPISFIPILLLALALIAIIASVGGVLLWCYVGMTVKSRTAFPKNPVKPFKFVIEHKSPSTTLFSSEIRKIFTLRTLIICLILIFAQIIVASSTLNGELSFYDEMKIRYMNEYADLTLEETRDKLCARLEHYNSVSNEETAHEMALKRIRGEITYEEYSAYSKELNEAITHKKTVALYLDEINYLIEKRSNTGIQASPVIATGFSVLTDRDFDLPVIALLFVLLSGVFALEHESSFKPLLSSTLKGRRHVWLTKFATAFACSLVISLLTLVPDLILLLSKYPTDYLSHPLFSIAKYSHTDSGITFLQYLILLCSMKIFGTVLLGFIIASLSQIIKTEWGTAICTLVLFVPLALTKIGVEAVKYLDITLILSGDRLYLLSTAIGNAYLMFIPILSWCLIVFVAIYYSRRSFCR